LLPQPVMLTRALRIKPISSPIPNPRLASTNHHDHPPMPVHSSQVSQFNLNNNYGR
jgi:hypothetical protein